MFGVHSGHQETPGAPEGQPEAHRECNPGRIRIMLPAKLNGTEPPVQKEVDRPGTQPPVRNATERPGTKQANPVRKQETRTGTRTKRTRDCRYETQLEPANQERNRQTRYGTGNCRYGTQLKPANPERNRQTPERNRRYGTQPANPVRNTTGTGQPGTEPEQNTTE